MPHCWSIKFKFLLKITAAWKKLVTEYDDKGALTHAHIHSFASLPKGKSKSATQLKKLRNAVSVVLAALWNLGCHVSYWDPILVYIITEKFGSKTRTEWNLKHGDTKEYASYQEINAFLGLVSLRTIREGRSSVNNRF